MKNLKVIFILLLAFPISGIAQEGVMVKWEFTAVKVAEQIYEFRAKAVIAEGWHIYAQDSGEGSSPTVFTFTNNPLVKLDREVIEQGELIKKKNYVLDSEIRYYADSVSFVQRVKINYPSLATPSLPKGTRIVLKGTVEFMACNESMCMPPEEVEFEVELK